MHWLTNARLKGRALVRSGSSGFTLVELLIVIVILGVLAGVVVFAVGAFSDRGERAACQADFKAVEVAVEAYRAQNGSYPSGYDDLIPDYLRQQPSSSNCTIDLESDGTIRATGVYEATSNGGGGGGGEPTEPTEPTAPAQVAGLSVVSASRSGGSYSVTIQWTAPADGGSALTGYNIQRATNSGFSGANTVCSNVGLGTSCTVGGLGVGNTYYVRVRATNAEGEGDWSATLSFGPPGAPSGLSYTNTHCTSSCGGSSSSRRYSTTLTWSPPSNGGLPNLQYDVVRAADGSCTDDDAETVANNTTATSVNLTSVRSGRTYCVRAENAAGTSSYASLQFSP